jgi:hypothetical protein
VQEARKREAAAKAASLAAEKAAQEAARLKAEADAAVEAQRAAADAKLQELAAKSAKDKGRCKACLPSIFKHLIAKGHMGNICPCTFELRIARVHDSIVYWLVWDRSGDSASLTCAMPRAM